MEGEERSVERTGRQGRKERRLKKRKITRNRDSKEVEIVRTRERIKKRKREQK